MKQRLNAVSPSFCLAKWLQVSIHLTTGRTHSCYHPISHKVPLSELQKNPSALHNTQFKKEQRKLMLEGKRPPECNYCWAVEDLESGDHYSDRFFRSSEPWAAERFEEASTAAWDQDIKPAYLEVNFNQACQFKCCYCSPALSSSWEQDVRKNGVYPTIGGHVPIPYLEKVGLMPIPLGDPNPYVDAFWKWWPEIYSSLRVFRMTGGEPLLDENTFRVFEYVKQNPNPNLSLSITSNMCPPDKNFNRFLSYIKDLHQGKSFKEFLLFASLDSVGKQAEYIRNGLNFDKFMNNVRTYLKEIPTGSISFINTFNALSVVGFPKFLDMIAELRSEFSKEWERVHFDTPRLYSPSFVSCKILPEQFINQLCTYPQLMRDRGFSQTEVEKIERLCEWAKIPESENFVKTGRTNFHLFFTENDKRKSLSFLDTFPEMKSFWYECHLVAQEHLLKLEQDK